jgi:hypothetical protein
MKTILDINRNQFGYLLIGINEKYVMYQTKHNSEIVPYYLKRVFPETSYITGLFYNKKRNEYRGKTVDGQKVIVKLGMSSAELNIY